MLLFICFFFILKTSVGITHRARSSLPTERNIFDRVWFAFLSRVFTFLVIIINNSSTKDLPIGPWIPQGAWKLLLFFIQKFTHQIIYGSVPPLASSPIETLFYPNTRWTNFCLFARCILLLLLLFNIRHFTKYYYRIIRTLEYSFGLRFVLS